MKSKSPGFKAVDILYIAGMIVPILVAIALKVMYIPASDGIDITGAFIYCRIPLPLGGLPITESQVNTWLVMVTLFFLCRYLTHGLSEKAELRRQHVLEWMIGMTQKLVKDNMGEDFSGFPPFVASILALSAFSSLLTLVGLYPPTSDINVVAGWAILVFFLITYYKMKCGPLHYLKSFAEPVAPLLPLNVISEVATPISMAFRHYGNILSGSVISVLIAAALQGLSRMVLGWLPGFLGKFPFLQIGLPAVLSLYFDIFSGCLQAFIFAMLTMLYIAGAFPAEDYKARKAKRLQKKMAKSQNTPVA